MTIRRIWIPMLAGTGVLILSYGSMLLYWLELPPFPPTPFKSRLVLFYVVLILAGALSGFLAWRMGARRWERLIAGISPVIVLVILYFAATRQKTIIGVITSVLNSIPFLFLGTISFLSPRPYRRREP